MLNLYSNPFNRIIRIIAFVVVVTFGIEVCVWAAPQDWSVRRSLARQDTFTDKDSLGPVRPVEQASSADRQPDRKIEVEQLQKPPSVPTGEKGIDAVSLQATQKDIIPSRLRQVLSFALGIVGVSALPGWTQTETADRISQNTVLGIVAGVVIAIILIPILWKIFFPISYWKWRLRRSYSTDKKEAATALGEIGGTKAILALIKALKDIDWDVRQAAATALGQIGDTQAVQPLTDALKDKDEDSNVRQAAATALGQIGDPQAIPALIDALKDRDVRYAAVHALGQIGDPQAIPALTDALKDKDWRVRQAAANALGKIGDPQAIPALTEALKDRYSDVRQAAANALGQIGDPQAVPALTEALEDEDSNVRRHAAEALDKLGWTPQSSAERINYLIAKQEWKELIKIGRPALPALTDALKDIDSNVRQAAATALGQIGDPQAVPALTEALEDKDRDVWRAAAEALGEIGDARALEALRILLSSKKQLLSSKKQLLSYQKKLLSSQRALLSSLPSTITVSVDDLYQGQYDVEEENPEYEKVKSNIASIERDIASINSDIASIERDIASIESAIDSIERRQRDIAEARTTPATVSSGEGRRPDRRVDIEQLQKLSSVPSSRKSAGVVSPQTVRGHITTSWFRRLIPFAFGISVATGLLFSRVDTTQAGSMSHKHAPAPLVQQAGHGPVRIAQLEKAESSGHPNSKTQRKVKELIRQLKSGDWYVCGSAARNLGKIGPDAKEAVPALIKALGDKKVYWDEYGRRAAAEALGQIGDIQAIPALTKALLDDEDSDVRSSAAGALGQIGDPQAIPALTRALEHSYSGVDEAAVRALVTIGEPAIPALIKALGDKDEDVRSSAAEALIKIGRPAVKPLIDAYFKYEGEHSRQIEAVLEQIDPKALGREKLHRYTKEVLPYVYYFLGAVGIILITILLWRIFFPLSYFKCLLFYKRQSLSYNEWLLSRKKQLLSSLPLTVTVYKTETDYRGDTYTTDEIDKIIENPMRRQVEQHIASIERKIARLESAIDSIERRQREIAEARAKPVEAPRHIPPTLQIAEVNPEIDPQIAERVDVPLVQKALRERKIDLEDIKDERLRAFLLFLKENGLEDLEDVVVGGGAVRDIFLGTEVADIDIGVKMALEDSERADFSRTTAQATERVYNKAMAVLDKFAQRLGVTRDDFFSRERAEEIRFQGGLGVHYCGPAKVESPEAGTLVLKDNVIDSESRQVFRSYTGAGLLWMAIDCDGNLYGRLESLQELLRGEISIAGDGGNFTINEILRLLRLKHQLGLEVSEEDYSRVRDTLGKYMNGESAISEWSAGAQQKLVDLRDKILDNAIDRQAAEKELAELGITALLPATVSSSKGRRADGVLTEGLLRGLPEANFVRPETPTLMVAGSI